MVIVRRAGGDDGELWRRAVVALVPSENREGEVVGPSEVAALLEDTRCYLFLALQGEEPVGLLNAFRFPDPEAGGSLVYLYDIEVDPDHRRAGIGAKLTTALVEACNADGVRRIWAGTDVANVAARRTFEKTGAELEGDRYVEYEWELED